MKVLWITCGTPELSSSMRIQSYPAHEYLLEHGHESTWHIRHWRDMSADEQATVDGLLDGVHILVLAKGWHPDVTRYAIRARELGIPVVGQLNGQYYEQSGIQYATHIVSPFWSVALEHDVRSIGASAPVTIIPDPPEPFIPPADVSRSDHGKRVLWIGRKDHLPSLQPLLGGLPHDWTLQVMTDAPGIGIAWDPALASVLIAQARAVAITNGLNTRRHSSPIRLLNGLIAGKPTLASPVSSYPAVVPGNGDYGWRTCQSAGDWADMLRSLRRYNIVEHYRTGARAVAVHEQQSFNMGQQWYEMLDDIYQQSAIMSSVA